MQNEPHLFLYRAQHMVNDVLRDAYAIPDMVNIVKLIRTMLAM